MTLGHEYHSKDNTPALYIAPYTDNGTALQLTGVGLTDANALHVAIVDGNGDQIVSFGGGTQYTNGGTPPANPIGPTLEFNNAGTWATVGSANPLPVSGSLSITNPTIGAAVPATANYVAGNKGGNLTGLLIGSTTTANSLSVALASDQVSIPVAATLAAETTKVIGTINVAASQTIAVTQATAASLNATVVGTGTFVTQSTLAAETTKVIGVTRTADGAGNLLTTNSTTYTAKFGLDANLLGTLGTAFSTAGKVDVKAADGDVFVRQATGTNLHTVIDSGTITTVSAVTAITNALPAGTALLGKVGIDQTTPGTTNAVSLAQIGGTTIVNGGLAGSQSIGGTVATNVAITDNPINNGAQAVSSENTAVTTARKVQLVADLVGKLIVLPYANPENFTNGTTAAIVDTTTTSVIAAQGAGVRTYITQITVTNSHATVGTFVKITDGASTILWEGYCASAGGGATATFPTPLRGTANTAVNAICVTTGANVIASVSGYKGA